MIVRARPWLLLGWITLTIALNLGKSWREDEEPRLGQFKLDGLGAAEVEEAGFDPLPTFEAAAPRDDDVLLMAV